MYLLIKYIKSVLWRAAKRLSYIEDARCLKVKIRRNVSEDMQTDKDGPFVKEWFPYTTRYDGF